MATDETEYFQNRFSSQKVQARTYFSAFFLEKAQSFGWDVYVTGKERFGKENNHLQKLRSKGIEQMSQTASHNH